MMKKLKGAFSAFMSLVLAVGLCPGFALAQPAEGDIGSVAEVAAEQQQDAADAQHETAAEQQQGAADAQHETAAEQQQGAEFASGGLSSLEPDAAASEADGLEGAAAPGETQEGSNSPDLDELVTVIVELEPGLTHGGVFGLFAQSGSDHQDYRNRIAELVNNRARQSEAQGGAVLGAQSIGYDVDGRDYYNVIDGFTVQVPRGAIDDIRALDGVAAAFESETHAAPADMGIQEGNPLNEDSLGMTGADSVSYTGKGQVIAIVDTGLKTDHEAFAGDLDDTSVVLTEDKVGEIKANLGEGKSGKYVSEKIPFAYDYAMDDNDVTDGSGHGTHVAGIAGANAGDVRGTAPDAQLVIMKVANDSGAIYDDALIAALDDCAKFDLAAVNISIGADGGFSGDAQDTMANAVNALEASGTVVNVAAGNSYSSAQSNLSGKNLPYATDPDSGTLSSPASAAQATAVACANNELGRSYFTTTDDRQVFWQYGIRQADNAKWKTLDDLEDGEWEIFDGGDGKNWIEYMDGFDASKNQIVLVERGGETWGGDIMSFDYKLYRAEGCKAIIVYDNVEASVPPSAMMDGSWTGSANRDDVAFATITQADGLMLLELAKNGGKIVLKSGQATEPSSDYGVNDFSSWGPTPDMSLKPDITAPGGNIYSTTNDGAYGYMSGTSMATPQMTGIAAQVREYVDADAKFASLSGEQKNDVVTQLLMSTAKPLADTAVNGSYYSPRQQGSGIANVPAATKTNVYLTVDGAVDAAHPKAELGESENGTWTFTVTLHNLGESPASYTPSAAALSDQIVGGLFQQHSANYTNEGIDVTFGGNAYQDGKVTVPAKGTASYTVAITCGDAFKQAVAAAKNGTFVDGFAFLKAEEGGVDLSVPFMGFYGDWSTAPIFDGKLGTDAAHLWGSYLETEGIGNNGGPLGYNPIADESIYSYANTISNKDSWQKDYNSDRLVVSNSVDPRAPHSVTASTYLLRGAAAFQWGFTKKGEEEGIQAYQRDYLRKSRPNTTGQGREPILTAEAIAGGYAQFSFNGLDEGWYQVIERAIVAGDEGTEPQELVYDIYYDKTAPTVSDIVNTEGDDAKVSFTVTDASWLAGVTVQTNPVYVTSTSESIKNYLDTDLNAQEKVDADGNRVYEVSVSIDDLKTAWIAGGYRNEDEMPNTLSLIAWDWGMNPSEPITAVLKPVPATGITVAPKSLSLVPGQHGLVEATLAPAETTDVQVDWSSSDEAVATVDANGQVTGVAPGQATITGTVHGRNVVATASVKVSDITTKTGVVLSDSVVRVRCEQGEKPATSVDVSAMLAGSLEDAAVKWTVSDEDIFSIEADPANPNKVTITGGYQVGVGTLSATVVDKGKIRSATVEVRNWPDDYEDFVIDEDGTLTAYVGASLSVEVPNDVTAIADSVFGDKRATEYRIPASVTVIGKEAFLDTPASTVAFEDTEEHPSHLVEIKERAFANDQMGQNGWSSIRFPKSLTTIGEGVMQGKSCNQIYVPEGVTVIPDRAFTGSHSTVYIGDDVTWIGDEAFSAGGPQAMLFEALYIIGKEDEQEDSLLPSKVEHIGAHAFQGTNIFLEVTMPDTLKYIGESAFNNASQSIHNNSGPALKVTLNDGLEYIGQAAFEGTRIEEIVIPDSVTEIGASAFQSCSILKKVAIGKNVGADDLVGAFVYDESLETFVADGCVNYTVDDQGILYNKDMTEVIAFPMGVNGAGWVIPEGVTTIKSGAFDSYDGGFMNFRDAYPASITFPDSLETIEANALNTYLQVVDLGENVKEVATDAFRDKYQDYLNPASPVHLVVRGGQDYTVGYTNNVDYFHTSYFGPGVKSIDFDGSGFRTSDIMVVNSDTLESFSFNTNWWPRYSQDPVAIYAKKGSEAYKTIKQAIEDKGIDFGYLYNGWCADVEDNESEYDGKRTPILRYYEELKASIDADDDIEPGSTVNLTVVPEGGVGDVQVRWFTCAPTSALGAPSTTAWLEGKTPLWGENEGDGWTYDLSYEWNVPEDGTTIVAEVRDASYYSVQASLADTPVFATQPESAKVLKDTQLVLSAEAVVSDNGTVTYQWFKSSSADMADAALVPGATSATYAVPTDELGTAYYAVVARNTLDGGLYAESRSDVIAVEVVDVDKDALDKAIAKAGAVEQGKKTDEAFAALQDAIADAKDVAGDEKATQLEVDAAVKALSDSVKAFSESADEPKPADDPSDSGSGAGSGAGTGGKTPEPATPSQPSEPSTPSEQPKPSEQPTPSEPSEPAPSQPAASGGDSAAPDKPSAPAKSGGDGSAAAEEQDGAMMRLYNPYSGEHLYTADVSERDNLVPLGWEFEGVGWIAPEWSNTPVYRMYNPYAGEHHYCMTAAERDSLVEAGWIDEGIGWYSDDDQRTPLYREYNPYMFSCNHNYTTDKEEHDYLVSLGWLDEGFAWYGM